MEVEKISQIGMITVWFKHTDRGKQIGSLTDTEVLVAYRFAKANKHRAEDYLRAEAFRRGLITYE